MHLGVVYMLRCMVLRCMKINWFGLRKLEKASGSAFVCCTLYCMKINGFFGSIVKRWVSIKYKRHVFIYNYAATFESKFDVVDKKKYLFCLLMTVIRGVPFGTFPVRISFELENVEKSGKKQISHVKMPSDSKDICGQIHQ